VKRRLPDIKPSGMIGPDKKRQFPEDMYPNVPWPKKAGKVIR